MITAEFILIEKLYSDDRYDLSVVEHVKYGNRDYRFVEVGFGGFVFLSPSLEKIKMRAYRFMTLENILRIEESLASKYSCSQEMVKLLEMAKKYLSNDKRIN